MRSTCFVVLPIELKNAAVDDVRDYVKNTINKYYIELEVEPYKEFFTDERTLEIAQRHGCKDVQEFTEYLKTHANDDGIENGKYYLVMTYNTQGKWDYYSVEEVKPCSELVAVSPCSVVTLDGVWHDIEDFGYIPKLDFERWYSQHLDGHHPDNITPSENWGEFLKDVYAENSEHSVAVLNVHS